jgi:glucose 1-dehydrogenase
MSKQLSNQLAIISGAMGDIGRSIALELARRGADIALGDVREPNDTVDFQKSISDLGVRVRYDHVDVSDAGQVEHWLEIIEHEMGTPSLIIPNAAVVTLQDFRQLTAAQWRRELSINLDGAFHLAQSATKRLLAQKRPGRVIFIGSWAAHAAHNAIPAYCVSKAGLRMLCKCMALDLAGEGILVNEVAPGYVDAGLTAQVWAKDSGAKDRAAKRVPTGRLIHPDEVAQQVAHLCSPENRHMTGSVLLMDGGLSLVTPAKR